MHRLFLSLLAAALAPWAAAENTHWEARTYTQSVKEYGKVDFTYSGFMALGRSLSGPDILLTCSDKFGLSATVLTKPASLDEILQSQRRSLTKRTSWLQAGDTDRRKGDWILERKSKALYPQSKWQSVRIFNAIVKGDIVFLELSRTGDFEITPPPVDESFRQFVRDCPAT